MKIPVYLVRASLVDRFGMEYQFRERRLVRQSPEDKVIAVIEAPRGSWIRTSPDEHGMDQLVVPARTSIWSRYLGSRRAIPVKYVINCARVGEHGLSVVSLAGSSGEMKVTQPVLAEKEIKN